MPAMQHCEVIKEIGKGHQGTTHLCRTDNTGELLVRKTAHKFNMVDDIPLEVKILKDTLGKHPRIINMKGYKLKVDRGITPRANLVMFFNYCSGGDLSRYESGKTKEQFLWHVFLQMAEALAYLHYGYKQNAPEKNRLPNNWQPVIHRDLKPDNMFLGNPCTSDNPYPDVVLGDFGFATLKPIREVGGALAYLPPEFEASKAGDVWSLGATIHKMAHGRAPVDDMPRNWPGGVYDWMERYEARNPRPLSRTYSSLLNRTMMACLKMDPRDRISSLKLFKSLRKIVPSSR